MIDIILSILSLIIIFALLFIAYVAIRIIINDDIKPENITKEFKEISKTKEESK